MSNEPFLSCTGRGRGSWGCEGMCGQTDGQGGLCGTGTRRWAAQIAVRGLQNGPRWHRAGISLLILGGFYPLPTTAAGEKSPYLVPAPLVHDAPRLDIITQRCLIARGDQRVILENKAARSGLLLSSSKTGLGSAALVALSFGPLGRKVLVWCECKNEHQTLAGLLCV